MFPAVRVASHHCMVRHWEVASHRGVICAPQAASGVAAAHRPRDSGYAAGFRDATPAVALLVL